ncbi:hypothetical protein MIMGU_mgv1a011643mg [Erythranthe guttata]|uniref:SRR1-like domain-containing protein n=1 Tax=Erythranthe guttata TaxID=4155 RepID=A0A022RR27_ERYGU|nr:PREDICTED: protein SENSITIVITY TO RED LIGHT REDUCED 1 [Erythranthe guttata]EYU42942.1 hypothetical protein MIMGU_mgv1a011643mg [Erythranthe guttata]EYU42943.1 hypothetical protein MIMGU_mgv1a011643mg [Erythranthe guttata]|eukprot:XP_012830694.1 PREDICTED: protein SENSITIVITY TO RED LIGHT REDUCED 1 [Erythranthe guttata]
MAASAEVIGPEKSSPTEEWTVVLPRRGKKNKLVIPKREKEVQLWKPLDLETDPERESKLLQKMRICIEKLENSEFCNSLFAQMQDPEVSDKFLKLSGTGKKMEMVIYGIGSIESFESPRLQLGLAILIKRKLDWIGEIQVFDPIISMTESKVLTSLGCSVLSINEQGRRKAIEPTLFFMPHCEAELYDNLLEANWGADNLNRVVIFGNSFGEYERIVSLSQRSIRKHSWRHILAVKGITEEFGIDTSFSDEFFRAFNGSSWHFFSSGNGAHLEKM